MNVSTKATTQLTTSNLVLPAIGTRLDGGYYAGQIGYDGQLFGLIMAGAGGEVSGRWNSSIAKVEDAVSRREGRENTISMDAAGSNLAARVLALNIEGFNDWYIPAVDELEILYRQFKPSVTKNYANDGINRNSVPTGNGYTVDSPAQTTIAVLIEGTVDALIPGWYWSSTQYAPGPSDAWFQNFDSGLQSNDHKSYAGRARAVRRFKI